MTPVALALTLAACSSTSQAPNGVDITMPPTDTSSVYILKADQEQGGLQADFLIMGLKAATQEQNRTQVKNLTARLDALVLSPMQTAEIQLIQAELKKSQNKYQDALQTLNFQPWWKLEDAQWKKYYQLRYELYLFNGDNINAARSLINSDAYTPEYQKAQLWGQVWSNVSSLNGLNLQSVRLSENEQTLQGWVQLATYFDTLKRSPGRLQDALTEWLQTHPSHPASVYTPKDITNVLSLEIVTPDNVALLLPLTGRFGPQGIRVRDGFINAMMDDGTRSEETTLKVIDTNITPMNDVVNILANQQIQFVVGPLVRSNIESFQSLNQANVSQLALNIPSNINKNKDSCYFTLSPEQEAEQAAVHLFKQGHKHPLFLAPQGKMGERLSQAFSDKWYQLTTHKPATSYFGKKSELQKQINSVFGLDSSDARIHQMKSLTRRGLEAQSRSRRDIDAVYMVAKSSELVLMKPFIEVAINPGVTVPKLYASSRSNSGRQTKLAEVRGIEFSDIPLLTNQNHSFKAQYNELWPRSSNGETRLHALGMDAYQLITELPQMKVVENYQMDGKTGELTINNECIIQRELSWAVHGDKTE